MATNIDIENKEEILAVTVETLDKDNIKNEEETSSHVEDSSSEILKSHKLLSKSSDSNKWKKCVENIKETLTVIDEL